LPIADCRLPIEEHWITLQRDSMVFNRQLAFGNRQLT